MSVWLFHDCVDVMDGCVTHLSLPSVPLFCPCPVADALEDCPPLAAASMWTRKELKEFRNSLHKDKESVLKIGSGETATVSISSHTPHI